MIFQTERLILRPWEESDAAQLYQWAQDPLIGPAAGWNAHRSVDDSLAMIRGQYAAPEVYAVCLRTEASAASAASEDASASLPVISYEAPNTFPIGCLSLKFGSDTDLTDAEDECEISAWIAKPYWGQGLIPEGCEVLLRHGFEDLGIKAIWAGYYDGNEKSAACLKRIGFRDHHIEKNMFLPLMNQLRTGHVVVMTREDWDNRSLFSQHP